MSDPTQTQDDEFSAAFAELQTPATSSTPTAAAAPAAPAEAAVSPSASAAAPADTPAAAAAVPAGEAGNPSAGTAAATPAVSAEASTSTAAQPAATPASEAQPDLAAQFAALQAELAELKRNPPAAAPAPTPAAQPTPTPTAAAPQSPFTPEEQAIVDSYVKEWPDMARGEMLLRRAEYGHLVNHIFEQLRPRLEALEAGYETSSTRTQYQDLVALVPDYDDVRDKTLAWIDTQPAYLKAAYQNVANTGSAKDVADLITRFKKETGYVAPAGSTPASGAAAAPAPAPTPTPAAGLAPAAAAAAASLRVVKSSRSEPVTTPDPDDFDAAFKEAVGG